MDKLRVSWAAWAVLWLGSAAALCLWELQSYEGCDPHSPANERRKAV
jgi:hypothetical protein